MMPVVAQMLNVLVPALSLSLSLVDQQQSPLTPPSEQRAHGYLAGQIVFPFFYRPLLFTYKRMNQITTLLFYLLSVPRFVIFVVLFLCAQTNTWFFKGVSF
jgi:hypothetical protein